MNDVRLFEEIQKKRSYLCIGLDPEISKIPDHLRSFPDPVFEFNRAIIEATHDLCVAYKPNVAFFEAMGASGWETLKRTREQIPADILTIADAKRGDIGNTSALYAKAFFEHMNFDAITVAPYMGEDSVRPFLRFEDKWVILLAHTSNPGSSDFQLLESRLSGRKLYEEVIIRAQQWGSPSQLMFVVGATHPDKIAGIRQLAPENFFLVPGVGAQGGDLEAVSRHGMNKRCGLLVNAARSIIYASSGKDFAAAARKEALRLRDEMDRYLQAYL